MALSNIQNVSQKQVDQNDQIQQQQQQVTLLQNPPGHVQKMIIGIGNPGEKYANNRHNVGFLFIDHLVKTHNLDYFKITNGIEIAFYETSANKFTALIKPQETFMNKCGQTVKKAFDFCKLLYVDQICLVHDDLETQLGKTKIKQGGSAQGHNGIKSIISVFDNNANFPRVKIGVSRPQSKDPEIVKKYVLEDFSQDNFKILEEKSYVEAIKILKNNQFL